MQNNSMSGAFLESTVDLHLDKNNPSANRLNAIVMTESVKSGNSQIDSTLLGADWFDTRNYTTATFESNSVLQTTNNEFDVSGTLSIRDVSRTISFFIILNDTNLGHTAAGTFTIDRREFNLGINSQPDDDKVGYEIVIRFKFDVQ